MENELTAVRAGPKSHSIFDRGGNADHNIHWTRNGQPQERSRWWCWWCSQSVESVACLCMSFSRLRCYPSMLSRSLEFRHRCAGPDCMLSSVTVWHRWYSPCRWLFVFVVAVAVADDDIPAFTQYITQHNIRRSSHGGKYCQLCVDECCTHSAHCATEKQHQFVVLNEKVVTSDTCGWSSSGPVRRWASVLEIMHKLCTRMVVNTSFGSGSSFCHIHVTKQFNVVVSGMWKWEFCLVVWFVFRDW